ncbi:hypothetical protein GEMRC1_003027 [Eukaryota sp. GEM-RC1]
MSIASLLDTETSFSDFGLDGRVSDAIYKLRFEHPTLIQSKSIPLILKGKDVLIKAHTGSGKTFSYLLPLIQICLTAKSDSSDPSQVFSLVLLPTSDLVMQVHTVLSPLISSLGLISSTITKDTSSPDLSLAISSNIIIATPKRLVELVRSSQLTFTFLKFLVLDECDLMMSFGFRSDLNALKPFIPSSCQCALLSATLDEEIQEIKKLFLHGPAVIKLQNDDTHNVTNQIMKLSNSDDRFLCLYSLVRLSYFIGRVLVFVDSIDTCYKIKILLERFDISDVFVVHEELPFNTRVSSISKFNQSHQSILIATDQGSEFDDYGMSRGIDFESVSHVVNFDFPNSVDNFIHRKGRTGRMGKSGSVLTF